MKKIIGILLTLTLFTSCANDKFMLSKQEYESTIYSTKGWNIYKNETIVVATVNSIEYELFNGKMYKEISVTLKSIDGDVISLLKYLHTKHPNDKIEINTDEYQGFQEIINKTK